MKNAVVLMVLAGLVVVAFSGCTVWRLGQSMELTRRSEPAQQMPEQPTQRVLIVGDSTGVGTGASTPKHSLAGLLATAHPQWLIENRARDGAQLAEVAAQLQGQAHFNLVIVQAGGNDVIRMRRLKLLQRDIERVADLAQARADVVVWIPPGNVGNAGFFYPPLSWLMTHRSRALHGLIAQSVQRTGAVYVKLFHEAQNDPFVKDPSLNASDGLHPSDAGYQVWFDEFQKELQARKGATP
jgi:lysophospholipase L1-like esterase